MELKEGIKLILTPDTKTPIMYLGEKSNAEFESLIISECRRQKKWDRKLKHRKQFDLIGGQFRLLNNK